MRSLLLSSLALLPALALAQPDASSFPSCLAGLQKKAQAQGISADSYERFTSGLQADLSVLDLLDAQPEFTTPLWDYLAGLVDEQRVSDGKAMLAQHDKLLDQVAARYGVDKYTVVAVWGVESDYGRIFGKRPLLTSLSTLSCYGRRQSFFQGEFLATLKLLQAGDIRDARHHRLLGRGLRPYPVHAIDLRADRRGLRRRRSPRPGRQRAGCPRFHRQLPEEGWLAHGTAVGL